MKHLSTDQRNLIVKLQNMANPIIKYKDKNAASWLNDSEEYDNTEADHIAAYLSVCGFQQMLQNLKEDKKYPELNEMLSKSNLVLFLTAISFIDYSILSKSLRDTCQINVLRFLSEYNLQDILNVLGAAIFARTVASLIDLSELWQFKEAVENKENKSDIIISIFSNPIVREVVGKQKVIRMDMAGYLCIQIVDNYREIVSQNESGSLSVSDLDKDEKNILEHYKDILKLFALFYEFLKGVAFFVDDDEALSEENVCAKIHDLIKQNLDEKEIHVYFGDIEEKILGHVYEYPNVLPGLAYRC